jgi:uncharacterized membrane protein (UPF0127 family)
MRTLIAVLALCLAGCSGRSSSADDFTGRQVELPDGAKIQAEVMTREADMRRGMMWRDSFPEGRGMLFIHGSPGKYPYWMYQVKVPLDIIWMDIRGRVVEVVENAPPCTTQASQCPNYGGNQVALVILELPGGTARKHGVQTGAVIKF